MSGKAPQHSPTPWRPDPDHCDDIQAADGLDVMTCGPISRDPDVSSANVAHVVRCVNLHDALVAALRETQDHLQAQYGLVSGDGDWTEEMNNEYGERDLAKRIRAVLAKVDDAEARR